MASGNIEGGRTIKLMMNSDDSKKVHFNPYM